MSRPRASGPIERLNTFVREYTEGMSGRELQRLFKKDAVQAYSVLTRDQLEKEPKGRCSRFVHRIRIVFLGLSYKLTPARRMLFAGAILLFIFGLTQGESRFTQHHVKVIVDFSPLWFLLAFGALVLLLALELVDRV